MPSVSVASLAGLLGGRSRGQGLVEYGMIIFLVALVVIGILTVLGGKVASFYNAVNASIP